MSMLVSARNKNHPEVVCTFASSVLTLQSVHELALDVLTKKVKASVVQSTISRVLIKQNALTMNIRHKSPILGFVSVKFDYWSKAYNK